MWTRFLRNCRSVGINDIFTLSRGIEASLELRCGQSMWYMIVMKQVKWYVLFVALFGAGAKRGVVDLGIKCNFDDENTVSFLGVKQNEAAMQLLDFLDTWANDAPVPYGLISDMGKKRKADDD